MRPRTGWVLFSTLLFKSPSPMPRRPAAVANRTYVDLETVLRDLPDHPTQRIVFERRPALFKFGARNYGDVPGWYNRADGDPWDVFAPGYDRTLPYNRPFRVRRVLGYLRLENGNHKIAVRLDDDDAPGYDATRATHEIRNYVFTYTTATRKLGRWVEEPSTPPRSAR